MDSLSDSVVFVNSVIWLNPSLKEERQQAKKLGYQMPMVAIRVPTGHQSDKASKEIYEGYRRHLEGACADIVVTTILPNGTPAVVALKRNKNKCFGGKWWMSGGSVPAYSSMINFVLEAVQRECGVKPIIEGLIGFFRTCAEDVLASTTQPCFVGFVDYSDISKICHDKDHEEWRLLTLPELEQLPEEETHWYPFLVFQQALISM